MEKRCWKCTETKDVSLFYKNKAQSGGYSKICKCCEADKKREYYKKYPEKKQQKRCSASYKKYRASEKYKLRQNEMAKIRREKTKNDPAFREKKNLRERELRANNPLYRLKENTRRRIREGFEFSGHKKGNRSEEILGCTYSELKIWLQGKFKKGMSWENYGSVWHIDHKIPLSTAKTEADVILLCHYRNLQPLFAKENMDKSDMILPIQVALQI